jgi:hypothetical protein
VLHCNGKLIAYFDWGLYTIFEVKAKR